VDGTAARRWVTKEVRSGEIGFSGPVRKNNFTAQQGRRRGQGVAGEVPWAKGVFLHTRGCQTRVPWAKGVFLHSARPKRGCSRAIAGPWQGCRRRRKRVRGLRVGGENLVVGEGGVIGTGKVRADQGRL